VILESASANRRILCPDRAYGIPGSRDSRIEGFQDLGIPDPRIRGSKDSRMRDSSDEGFEDEGFGISD
jgi:hypothetical protein